MTGVDDGENSSQDILSALGSVVTDGELGDAAQEADLDVEALKKSLSAFKLQQEQDDVQRWKAAFGDDAAISNAQSNAEADDDQEFEVIGTF